MVGKHLAESQHRIITDLHLVMMSPPMGSTYVSTDEDRQEDLVIRHINCWALGICFDLIPLCTKVADL